MRSAVHTKTTALWDWVPPHKFLFMFLRRQIVDGALRFARDHKDATGFAPAGFALYFVRREGARARMAHGAYRCAGPACRSRV